MFCLISCRAKELELADFLLGFWVLAFCHWRFVLKSNPGKQLLATTSMSAAELCNQSKLRLRRHRMTSHLQLVPYPCLG